jgi:hypothetical protein
MSARSSALKLGSDMLVHVQRDNRAVNGADTEPPMLAKSRFNEENPRRSLQGERDNGSQCQ